MRRALVMWCWLALAACRSSGEPAPATKSEPAPPPATAAPAAPAAPDTPRCRKDSDCALTLVPDGDCCPRLCAPRAVPADEARRVNDRVQRCERENHPCVMPSCRARSFEPACVDGACSARAADAN